jgi:hypothetical protein
MDLRPDKSWRVRSTSSPLTLALGLLLVTSLALNLFLGWKVVTLRRGVAKENLERQLEIGIVAPPIRVRGMDGSTALITYGRGDAPTVLYFFSPGCDTCERNVENIKRLANLKKHEYRIVGLSLSEDGLEQYAKDHDLNFPVYAGLGVDTTLAYKLGRVPQTTIVSGDGRVLANWYGAYDGKLRPAIESYFQINY